MSTVRIVSFNSLRRRLAAVLGSESSLFRRFSAALRSQNEVELLAVMASLDGYPDGVKRDVESTLLAWLFDADDASGLLDLPAVSEARH